MARRVWLAIGSTLGAVVLVANPAMTAMAATAQLVDEPFTGSTTSSANWVRPAASVAETNDACLTASSNTSQTPIPGCATTAGSAAGLQLTTNIGGKEGGLAYSSSVPSSLGLDVRFNSYQYSGSSADGIAFFLAASDPNNASASPITLGPPGGHLGYSSDVGGGTAGLTRGYLGVGLDAFGNFANPTFAGTGCTDSTTDAVPQSVDVRGPGNGTAGYCLLNNAQTAGPLDSATPQAVPVEVAVNPTNGALTAAGGFTVPARSYVVMVTPISAASLQESGSLPDATPYVPDASWVDGHGVPVQLSFGWSASTGEETDFHTISDVHVDTLNGTPPTLAVSLTDNSGGTAVTGQTVTYSAVTTLSGADETRPITLTDTFPAALIPQAAGLGGVGWTCSVSSQTVTCTHPAAAIGALSAVAMPVVVAVPAGSSPVTLTDTATAGSPDATQGSGTDIQTYSAAPSATVLAFVGQPVSSQVNTAMKNANATTTHVRVAADVSAGGAIDTTYHGLVTLAFASNPGNASFVVGSTPTPTLTATAVNGVADFSPIVINAIGFGYTLKATAAGVTPATSTAFDVNGAATSCPSGQTCTVQTTSTAGGLTAKVQAQPGAGNAIVTATFGGNVVPIHPCMGATSGILTFSGDRKKLITITRPKKSATLLFCYGQPTPFRDIRGHLTTYFNPINKEYEGVLPACFFVPAGPCVKSLAFTKTTETVVIFSGTADPRIMG